MKICYNCFNEIPDGARTCPRCGSSADLRNVDKYPHALPCGSVLNGRYIVGRVLGQGGFGITYVGQDFKTKKLVAIKEYFPDTMAARDATHSVMPFNTDRRESFEYGKKQFLDEAKTLSAFIGSPNIVRVYGYFEENGTAYFVMEYVGGKSLRQYIADHGGRLSWEETWNLLMPVLDALSEVHYRNIIHRDIKPDNIIITKNGSAKLIDFGAARYSYSEKSKSLTAVLTPGYAPLEQYFTRGRQGPWTDVYALAATIYFCITGKVPIESVERSVRDELKKPSELGVSIPDYAEAALMKALAVREEDRFESTYDFRNSVLERKQEEEEDGIKSMASEQKDIIFRDTQKKAVAGDVGAQPHRSNTSSKSPQPHGSDTNSESPQPHGSNTSTEGSQPYGSNTSSESPQSHGNIKADGGSEGGLKGQGASKPDTLKKGDTRRISEIILLAVAMLALITAVGIGISKASISSISVEKDTPSQSEEDIQKEESVQISRDSMELTDTWEEIIAASHDGTYKERYRIGDTKELDMGSEGIITMKLVAMDEDELADGSGKAPMTWVADELLESEHKMNLEETNEGGWEASELRFWLRETILPQIPEEVRNNIWEVTKYSLSYVEGSEEGRDVVTKDTIWIPSRREVFYSDIDNQAMEDTGPVYSDSFIDWDSRKRVRNSRTDASAWWLRSVSPHWSDCFYVVASDGSYYGTNAIGKSGVLIGFCL